MSEAAAIKLGDVEDLDAYIAGTVRRIAPNASTPEIEEALADGREIAWTLYRALDSRERERFSDHLSNVLGNDLRDRWRQRNKWHRRDGGRPDLPLDEAPDRSEAGFEDDAHDRLIVRELIASRGALDDPRVAGQLRAVPLGIPVPSYRPAPPSEREDYWRARLADDDAESGFDFKK